MRGVPGVVSILSSKAEELPYVLVDSDVSGQDTVKKLNSGLYKDQKDRIIQVKDITSIDNSEVEDIIPYALLSRGIDRLFLTVEDETFQDIYDSTLPVLPQIEGFAKKHSIELKQGWKVELAKSAKQLLKNKKEADIDEETKTKWVNLFKKFEK